MTKNNHKYTSNGTATSPSDNLSFEGRETPDARIHHDEALEALVCGPKTFRPGGRELLRWYGLESVTPFLMPCVYTTRVVLA